MRDGRCRVKRENCVMRGLRPPELLTPGKRSLAAVVSSRGIAFALLAAIRSLLRELPAAKAVEWLHQQNDREQRQRHLNASIHSQLLAYTRSDVSGRASFSFADLGPVVGGKSIEDGNTFALTILRQKPARSGVGQLAAGSGRPIMELGISRDNSPSAQQPCRACPPMRFEFK